MRIRGSQGVPEDLNGASGSLTLVPEACKQSHGFQGIPGDLEGVLGGLSGLQEA